MAQKLEDKLASLEAYYAKVKAAEHPGEIDLQPLVTAIGDRNNVLVSKAAWLASEMGNRALVEPLREAFDRFLEKPTKTDPSCIAKNAIILALYNLDYQDLAFYRSLMHYRQMEPGFDEPEDLAMDVRRITAAAIAASNDHRSIMDLVLMLDDPIKTVRASVVKSISTLAPQLAEVSIRQKLSSGDPSAEVIDECFRALIQINRDDSIPLIEPYLDSLEVADYAAFALGESRDIAAFKILENAYQTRRIPRQTAIQAISLARIDEAVVFLVKLIRTESEEIAELAYTAMESYSDTDYEKAREAFLDRF